MRGRATGGRRSSAGARSAGQPVPAGEPARADIERAIRGESGRALASVARLVGDLDLAEDAVQEAFAEACAWPSRGVADRPGAWILTVARHRALDRVRREARRGTKEEAAAAGLAVNDGADTAESAMEGVADDREGGGEVAVTDDRLRLIFTCCHPALAPPAQVALTLRLVCGLQTAEIARAFLQPEATVAQRLVRAKAKIRTAGIPLRVPPDHLLPERLPPVLACIYLVFTESYAASAGDRLIRDDLCDDRLARLARLTHRLMPDEPEVEALLALALLQDSRRVARRTPEGDLVPLEEQDRSRWNRAQIDEGLDHLARALRRAHSLGAGGSYLAQATSAAAHAAAATWEATDWAVVVAPTTSSPAWRRRRWWRSIAPWPWPSGDGPAADLEALDAVAADVRLGRSHVVAATRADLLRRLGRCEEARLAYEEALTRVSTTPQRRYLERRWPRSGRRAVPLTGEGPRSGGRSRERGRGGLATCGVVRSQRRRGWVGPEAGAWRSGYPWGGGISAARQGLGCDPEVAQEHDAARRRQPATPEAAGPAAVAPAIRAGGLRRRSPR